MLSGLEFLSSGIWSVGMRASCGRQAVEVARGFSSALGHEFFGEDHGADFGNEAV